MGERQSWRDLLGELTSDSIERQRIASAIGINPVTLTRWVGNKSSPRIDNVRQLLDALPQRREQLFTLMQEEFPELATYEQEPIESMQEIPPAFYAHVMNAFASSPPILRAHHYLPHLAANNSSLRSIQKGNYWRDRAMRAARARAEGT
jgi:AcrR family transcriptional regulator